MKLNRNKFPQITKYIFKDHKINIRNHDNKYHGIQNKFKNLL